VTPADTTIYTLTVTNSAGITAAQTATVTVNAAGLTAQTITFANPGTQTVGTPLSLVATATSGLTVSFASTTTSVCTVSGTTATFLTGGTCSITASQAGNATYAAATPVTQSFTVNAVNGMSGNTIGYSSCPAPAGSGTQYTIGMLDSSGNPSGPQTIAAFTQWNNLNPGDVVCIYGKSTPYAERLILTRGGSDDQHRIRIVGVIQNGFEPILTGKSATTAAAFNYGAGISQYYEGGEVSVTGLNYGTPVAYLNIEGLTIEGATTAEVGGTVASPTFTSNTYSDPNINGGAQSPWGCGAAGINLIRSDHISIIHNRIKDNDNGIFVNSNNGNTSSNILVESNHIYGNGVAGNTINSCTFDAHGTYTEAENITYLGNRFGALRQGQAVNLLKDRSSGLFVEYNLFLPDGALERSLGDTLLVGSAPGPIGHLLDLVESYDSSVGPPGGLAALGAVYDNVSVYGNIFFDDGAAADGSQGAENAVHFGGDQGNSAVYRKYLHYYNNTVVARRADGVGWLEMEPTTNAGAWNNIFYAAYVGSSTPPAFNLLSTWCYDKQYGYTCGTVNYLGQNWNSPIWATTGVNGSTDSNPNFVNLANDDVHIATNDPTIVGNGQTGDSAYPANSTSIPIEYADFLTTVARPYSQATIDLGALGYSAGALQSQTITFPAISAQTVGTPLTLSATASSGLTVSFTSTTTSVCTVSGATATFIAAGTCSITASQPGNATYAAAPPVSQSFTVNAAGLTAQTITFNNPGSQTVGTSLTLVATASSGLPVSFASQTTSVCTVSGTTATFITTDTCTIQATQAGNATYAAATPVSQSFMVSGALACGSSSYAFPAGPTYSSQSGPATLSRTTTWAPGISGGVPNRTTICATLSPAVGGADDGAAISAAIASCPDNEVVMLNPGTYTIKGTNNIIWGKSNVVLRGSGGPGVAPSLQTRLMGDPSLVGPVVNMGIGLWPHPLTTSANLTADAMQGANSVTVDSTTGFNKGDLVILDIVVDPADDTGAWIINAPTGGTGLVYPYAEYNPTNSPAGSDSRGWFSRMNRPVSQIMEIQSIAGNTVTFTTTFHMTFDVAHSAQMTGFDTPALNNAGLEDVYVSGVPAPGGNNQDNNVSLNLAKYSWVKNVESDRSNGYGIGLDQSFRSIVRDSYVHSTINPTPGGAGYGLEFSSGSADNLVENNISWNFDKVDVMRASGGGNVLAYNYMDDGWIAYQPNWVESGINAAHMTTPHFELFEGNLSFALGTDDTWGGSTFLTWLRNVATTHRSAWPPLNTYTFDATTQTTGCTSGGPNDFTCIAYTDVGNRQAATLTYGDDFFNYVGNVLGSLDAPVAPQAQGFTYANSAPDWVGDPVPMWVIGFGDWNGDSAQDQGVANTIFRDGNYDYATHSTHWNGAPQTLPDSLYLCSKPAFFGSYNWPWSDGSNASTPYLTHSYQYYPLSPALGTFGTSGTQVTYQGYQLPAFVRFLQLHEIEQPPADCGASTLSSMPADCSLLFTGVPQNAGGLTAQSITFANPGAQTVGTPLTLVATASSGLPVSFTSTTTGVCTVNGTTATFIATGTCSITASQPGNSTYAAATPVSQIFAVNSLVMLVTSISIPTTASMAVGSSTSIGATVSPANATRQTLNWVSSDTTIATVSGGLITGVKAGTATITAESTDGSNITSNNCAVTVTAAATTASSARWISGYWADWQSGQMVDQPDEQINGLPIANINWANITHGFFATVAPLTDGTIASFNETDAAAFTAAAHAAGRKAILMIGGWGAGSGYTGATSSTVLPTFVSNILSITSSLGFDGADLDWEDDRIDAQWIALAQSLRAASPREFIITVPFGGDASTALQLSAYVDQINLMTYGVSGNWEGWQSWFFAPITGDGPTTPASVTRALKPLLTAGIPRSKIGIGVGFFGSDWHGGNYRVTGPMQPVGGNLDNWDGSIEPYSDTALSYWEIDEYYKQPNPTLYHWDDTAKQGYLSFTSATYTPAAFAPNGDTSYVANGHTASDFLSYEDFWSTTAKGAFARAQNLGGMIVWTINEGVTDKTTYASAPLSALANSVLDNVPAMPLISRSLPCWTSSGGGAWTEVTNSYDNPNGGPTNWWNPGGSVSGIGASVAYDLSTVHPAQRRNLLVFWSGYPFQDNWVSGTATPSPMPSNYVIEANDAAGGGTPPSSDDSGWVVLKTVSNYVGDGGQHLVTVPLDAAGQPYPWIRMRVTTIADGSNNAMFYLDLFDARQGNHDSMAIMGDSITADEWNGAGGYIPTENWEADISAQRPYNTPAVTVVGRYWAKLVDPAAQGVSDTTGSLINQWIDELDCHYVALAYGANDAGATSPADFETTLRAVVDHILSVGKVPIITQRILWRDDATLQIALNGTNSLTTTGGLNQAIANVLNDPKYAGEIVVGPDLWAAFFNQPTWLAGGLHPWTADGAPAYKAAWLENLFQNVYTR
jgi:GH18 family chitinase